METLEDEYCPDCGKYGTHTCKGTNILSEWYDKGQKSKAKTGLSLDLLLKDLFNCR